MLRGTKPDGKRNRRELGSSDLDNSSSDIRESLFAIKHQLEKLDLLDRMIADVNELKASVEFNNSLIETLMADKASLRTEVNNLKRLTDKLQNDNHNMAKELLDLQCRSMRNNIIFHGLSEAHNETHHKSEELVQTFLVDNLKMKAEEAEAIHFSRVHCLGKASQN